MATTTKPEVILAHQLEVGDVIQQGLAWWQRGLVTVTKHATPAVPVPGSLTVIFFHDEQSGQETWHSVASTKPMSVYRGGV